FRSDLEHLVDRSSRHPMAAGYGDHPVEPAIFLGCRLIVRRGAHIVFRRTDVLTTRHAVHHFLWPMTHAEIRHANENAIIGLHHQAHIQSRRAVTTQRLPVAAARKNFAAQPLAFETATSDFAHTSVVAGCRADHTGRFDLDLEYKQRLITHRGHVAR